MSQPNGRAAFLREVERAAEAPSFPPTEQNPVLRAAENYTEMERQVAEYIERNRQLVVDKNSLLAEVNMLRDALERSDSDRIRLQAVSSTLAGQLLAINAVIGDAMRTAIRNGIAAGEQARAEPAEPAESDLQEQAAQDDAKIDASQQPPQVDWRNLPQ